MNVAYAPPPPPCSHRRPSLIFGLFKLVAFLLLVGLFSAVGSVAGTIALRQASLERQGSPSRVAERFVRSMAAGDLRRAARESSPEVAMGLEAVLKAHPDAFKVTPGSKSQCGGCNLNVGDDGVDFRDSRDISFSVARPEGAPGRLEIRTNSGFRTEIVEVLLDGKRILPTADETKPVVEPAEKK